MNVLLFTIPAAILPALLLVLFFWKNDKLPEPPVVVGITFALGIFSIIPAIAFAIPFHYLGLTIVNPILLGLYKSFFSAAIPEELAKFLVIYFYCSRHSSFDEEMDGLVYGATASLGFAALENILYVSKYGYGVAITRAFTSVPCHAIFGMFIGYYIAKWRFSENKSSYIFFKGLLIAIVLHGLYDTPLLIQKYVIEMEYNVSPFFYFITNIVSWFIIIRIFRYAYKIIKKVKQQQIAQIDDQYINEIANELNKYKSIRKE